MNPHNQLPVSLTIRKFGIFPITEVIICPNCKHRNYIKANPDFKPPYTQAELCWFCRRVAFWVDFISDTGEAK